MASRRGEPRRRTQAGNPAILIMHIQRNEALFSMDSEWMMDFERIYPSLSHYYHHHHNLNHFLRQLTLIQRMQSMIFVLPRLINSHAPTCLSCLLSPIYSLLSTFYFLLSFPLPVSYSPPSTLPSSSSIYPRPLPFSPLYSVSFPPRFFLDLA